MSCSVTERVADNRAGVGVGPPTENPSTGSATVIGCRLRGTNNASLTTSPNSRGTVISTAPPQNGPQTGPQGAPLRPKPCCLLWCCCCKCPCSNPGNKSNEEIGPTIIATVPVSCDGDPPPTLDEIQNWGRSFDRLMRSSAGRQIFRDFLRGEYSEENILFWLACDELKRETNPEVIEEKARIIYEDYISILSPKEVSLDSQVREIVNRNMVEPTPHTFDEAQLQIYTLMHRDSYPRFVNSPQYRSLSHQTLSSTTESESMTVAVSTDRDQDG